MIVLVNDGMEEFSSVDDTPLFVRTVPAITASGI